MRTAAAAWTDYLRMIDVMHMRMSLMLVEPLLHHTTYKMRRCDGDSRGLSYNEAH